jgi:hypothetical protein
MGIPPVAARQRLGKHVSVAKNNYLRRSRRLVIARTSCLILSSHQCLGLPSGIFPSGFPTITKYRLRGEIRNSVGTLHDFNMAAPENYASQINHLRETRINNLLSVT